MTTWRGFTVVELAVVMVIMAILLTLGVASYNSYQVNVRDSERLADINAIAKGLEARYDKGNPSITLNAPYFNRGSYPSVNEILHAEGSNVAGLTPNPNTMGVYTGVVLPGTTAGNFYPPGVNTSTAITSTFKVICTASCAAAENTAQRDTAINNSPNVYVYEPITANNQICINTECVRYNLYYRPEAGGSTTQTIASKHQ